MPGRSVKRSAWVALVVDAGLIVTVCAFFAFFVARPMRQLSQLALKIAGSDSVHMPTRGGDELSELGHALNGMADALQHQATVARSPACTASPPERRPGVAD